MFDTDDFYDWYKALYAQAEAEAKAYSDLSTLHKYDDDRVPVKSQASLVKLLQQTVKQKSFLDLRLSSTSLVLLIPFRLDEMTYIDHNLQYIGVMTISEVVRHLVGPDAVSFLNPLLALVPIIHVEAVTSLQEKQLRQINVAGCGQQASL